MSITLELYELKNICMQMAELGAANYVKRTKPGEDLISQREAYREFQEVRVKNWVKKDLVAPPDPKFSIQEPNYLRLINPNE